MISLLLGAVGWLIVAAFTLLAIVLALFLVTPLVLFAAGLIVAVLSGLITFIEDLSYEVGDKTSR